MPINPLAYVAAQEPSIITTPLEGKRSRLLVDADEMKIAQARRAIQREQQLDQALQQMGPNVTPEGIQGIMRADPRIGIQMQDKYNEEQNRLRDDKRATDAAAQKLQDDQRKQQEAAEHAKLTRAALSLARVDPKDTVGRQTAIDVLLQRGDIDQEDAQGLLSASPEQFLAHRNTLEGIALDPDKFTKLMEERRQGETAASQNAQRTAQLPGEQADAQGKVLAMAAQRLLAVPPPARAIMLQSMEKEAPGISQYFPAETLADTAKLRSVGLTPQQNLQADQTAAQAAALAADRAAQDALTRRGQDITVRGQNLTDARSKAGQNLEGAKLEQGAVQKIAEFKEGLIQIGNLEKAIKDGAGYMGPVAGMATAPIIGRVAQAVGYTGPAQLEAKINLIKQTIGKALEGGVLRKEDEEKYAKILPTIDDVPEVAAAKVADLKQKLTADLANFEATQEAAGRKPLKDNSSPKKADPLGIR